MPTAPSAPNAATRRAETALLAPVVQAFPSNAAILIDYGTS
jgi:hypothetical protein